MAETSHNERNKLIKEAKEFRGQCDNGTLTEAPLEGIRPTGCSTGEGAWPGGSSRAVLCASERSKGYY